MLSITNSNNNSKGSISVNNNYFNCGSGENQTVIVVQANRRHVSIVSNAFNFHHPSNLLGQVHSAIAVDGESASIIGNKIIPRTLSSAATYKFLRLSGTSANCLVMGNMLNGAILEDLGTSNVVATNTL